jgi:hypothetical protein
LLRVQLPTTTARRPRRAHRDDARRRPRDDRGARIATTRDDDRATTRDDRRVMLAAPITRAVASRGNGAEKEIRRKT